ncbi:hypothetical protein SERLA73DRAFT_176397 [Serpula lacrymans var. lacrymans S7.3]|uniref:Uncharacterized protein n=2 Tax=Serpula lacrymans var. lacrymans TaxID=341189 RepID=F8PMU4_SERL3|nr:uncharacterized protein SERLADRAFT_459249 [Serpula lacrymans var. lacrymans S7.9]EGO02926.1 hypothetical protein SERLA73DRAFT_176397 [Serpula lacrymans var. lacrymans S7.3]EGO28615.1 hypothetical protein SERLADRAFT_459249 [Serpula lacrymans var. lacrymans S7.9]
MKGTPTMSVSPESSLLHHFPIRRSCRPGGSNHRENTQLQKNSVPADKSTSRAAAGKASRTCCYPDGNDHVNAAQVQHRAPSLNGRMRCGSKAQRSVITFMQLEWPSIFHTFDDVQVFNQRLK